MTRDATRFAKIEQYLPMLRCPVSGQKLLLRGDALVSEDGGHVYRVTDSGIPLFADGISSPEAKVQRRHYNRIAKKYIDNLTYPHTQEYLKYLDRLLLDIIPVAQLGTIADICCGQGEAFRLLEDCFVSGVGVDISEDMLEAGRENLGERNVLFMQGDATTLPLADGLFDSVIMLGGIHHVNDRETLYSEIFRILKPGGSLIWREPSNDFALWRWLRAVVYRVSPTLDHETEHPLLYRETVLQLKAAGLEPRIWRTYGFVGFMVLMNSDVLVVNRMLRFVPGIRWLTGVMISLDDWIARLPFLKHSGLQVIGMAQKPD